MPSSLSPAEFYRREAARLRRMAEAPTFSDVRHGLLSMADEYELMADQRDGLHRHVFGQPFHPRTADSRTTDRAHPRADDQQDNAEDRQRAG